MQFTIVRIRFTDGPDEIACVGLFESFDQAVVFRDKPENHQEFFRDWSQIHVAPVRRVPVTR